MKTSRVGNDVTASEHGGLGVVYVVEEDAVGAADAAGHEAATDYSDYVDGVVAGMGGDVGDIGDMAAQVGEGMIEDGNDGGSAMEEPVPRSDPVITLRAGKRMRV